MPYKDKEQQRRYRREYHKKWYERNKKKVMDRSKARSHTLWEWYRTYKTSLSCKMCGETHPACLQFHHRDKTDKSFSIGSVATRVSSKKRLLSEIEKCDVLCVNCHAKLHWRERRETDDCNENL